MEQNFFCVNIFSYLDWVAQVGIYFYISIRNTLYTP